MALGVIQLEAIDKYGHVVPATILLDEGSDTTLIREGFADQLGVKGVKRPLTPHHRLYNRYSLKISFDAGRYSSYERDGRNPRVGGAMLPTATNLVPVTPC